MSFFGKIMVQIESLSTYLGLREEVVLHGGLRAGTVESD